MRKITVKAASDGKILKALSVALEGESYGGLSSALRKKDVTLNGERVRDNVDVRAGDVIEIFLPDKRAYEPDIVYQDDNVLIVNKPKQIEVCDGEHNLVRALAEVGIEVLPVHRLDRNTTGLVIFAKTDDALRQMIDGLKLGGAKKFYLAEVYGAPATEKGVFTDYMVKNAQKSLVKVYDKQVLGAKKAVTEYELISSDGKKSLLSVAISKGVTHQIRACLAHHGLPIIGDGKYGSNSVNKAEGQKTQRLKCYKIRFGFPLSNKLCYLNRLQIKIKAEL